MSKSIAATIFAGVLGLIILLPSWQALLKPAFFHMHDFTHVARLAELEIALMDGHIPAGWSANLGYGYGLPQFTFYAPLNYYISVVFVWLGADHLIAIKLLIISLSWLGFMAAWWIGYQLIGFQAGILMGSAFGYAEYRLMDIFVRGALSEVGAMTYIMLTIALMLWQAKKPTVQRTMAVAISLAAIMLTHNLSALIAYPALGLVWICLALTSPPFNYLRAVARVVVGFLFGLGLSAFYWVPALGEKGFTMANTLTTEFSNFRHHFLYLRQLVLSEWGYGGSIFGLGDEMSFNIGLIHVGLLIPAGIVVVRMTAAWKSSLRQKRAIVIAWLSIVVTGVSILLTTFKTQWLWERIELMAFIQFPWRYLLLVAVFVSILIGYGSVLYSALSHRWQVVLTSLIVILLVGFGSQWSRPEAYLEDNQALYYTDPIRIITHMSEIIPDFMPLHGKEPALLEPSFARVELLHPDGTTEELEPEVNRVHEILVLLEQQMNQTLRINSLYFPGWTLYVNGTKVEPTLDEQWPIPMVFLESNEQYVISYRLEDTPMRQASKLLSLLSLMVIVGVWLQPRKGIA